MPIFSQWPRRTAITAGFMVLLIGMLALAGWCLGVPALKSVIVGWPVMKPLTAVCFTLASLSLLLAAMGKAPRLSQACAAVVATVGVARMCYHVAGVAAPFDYFWFNAAPDTGGSGPSMSPAAAFNFFVLGSALLLAHGPKAFGIFQIASMTGLLVGWLGFSRYYYGGEPLTPLAHMAVHTSLAFLILSLGTLLLRGDRGVVGLLTANSAGGTIARRLLPPALMIPFIFGWLRYHVEIWGWLGPQAALTVFSLMNIIILGTLVCATALVIHRLDEKRRAAEQVRAQFAAIVASSGDAIISKDLQGIITSWNPGAEKLFGYKAGEVTGKPMTILFPPDKIGEEADILSRIARGERINHFETTRVTKSGERIEVSVSISPIVDEKGKILGASKIARDITDKKRAEEKALWLASFPARNPNPIVELDMEKWVLHYVNPIAEQLFPGLDKQGIKHPWLDGIQDLVKPLVDGSKKVVYREVMVGSSCFSQSISHVPEAGRVRVYSTDITERKQAEEKTHSQLERLALLHRITRAIGERQDLKSIFHVVVRNVEDKLPVDFCCVCLYSAADNKLTIGGTGAHGRIPGLEPGTPIPIDRNGLSRCIQGHLVYEPDIVSADFPFPRLLAKAGLRSMVLAPMLVESTVFGVLVSARRQAESFSSGECEFLSQLSGHVALAAHQAQLYGALQQAYNDLRQSQQTVMQQERLRALGQMASGIAHDINNAISPASLYTESMLEKEEGLSERARNHLTIIQRAIDDVAATVARMKEFYRQREPQLDLAPVDLGQMIEQVADLTRARWSDMPQRRGIVIDLKKEITPGVPAIMGVASEIREALTNLIFNAVDAMPDGGTLTLRTGLVPAAPANNGHAPAPGHITLTVSDSGAGMDEDTRRRCLEPFFTTKGERGTGLGLAMVYGIAQRHNATIDIESAPGKGTVIRLGFPLPEIKSATGAPAGAAPPQRVATRLRVLTVDDDPVVIESLRHILEGDGHVVTAANDGREGIDAFAAAHGRGEIFDIVITDLGMPYVDGRRVAAAVKEQSPSTPVILLTGWGQRLMVEKDIPPGVDRVLNKPPKLSELREALAACFNESISPPAP